MLTTPRCRLACRHLLSLSLRSGRKVYPISVLAISARLFGSNGLRSATCIKPITASLVSTASTSTSAARSGVISHRIIPIFCFPLNRRPVKMRPHRPRFGHRDGLRLHSRCHLKRTPFLRLRHLFLQCSNPRKMSSQLLLRIRSLSISVAKKSSSHSSSDVSMLTLLRRQCLFWTPSCRTL